MTTTNSGPFESFLANPNLRKRSSLRLGRVVFGR